MCSKVHLCYLMMCHNGLFFSWCTVFKTTCSSLKPLPPALHLNLHHACVCGNCVGTFSWKERRGYADQIRAKKVMIQKTASKNYPLIDLLGDNLIPPNNIFLSYYRWTMYRMAFSIYKWILSLILTFKLIRFEPKHSSIKSFPQCKSDQK